MHVGKEKQTAMFKVAIQASRFDSMSIMSNTMDLGF